MFEVVDSEIRLDSVSEGTAFSSIMFLQLILRLCLPYTGIYDTSVILKVKEKGFLQLKGSSYLKTGTDCECMQAHLQSELKKRTEVQTIFLVLKFVCNAIDVSSSSDVCVEIEGALRNPIGYGEMLKASTARTQSGDVRPFAYTYLYSTQRIYTGSTEYFIYVVIPLLTYALIKK